MKLKKLAEASLDGLRLALTGLALIQFSFGGPVANAQQASSSTNTPVTPIKHVIVIIGENRSFDHVFATYVPPKKGETVNNLLSEGIIKLDSTKNALPGPNFDKAQQFDASSGDSFLLSPPKQSFPNNQLPAPLTGGPSGVNGYFSGSNPCNTPAGQTPLTPVQCAQVSEPGLPTLAYYESLASGGTGQKSKVPDQRITNVTSLEAGPFQLTNGSKFLYTDYAASPVHRFYQMWQQLNCGSDHATPESPNGCNGQLFAWVETTVGAGTNGTTQPPLCSTNDNTTPCFTTNYLPAVPTAQTTGEGSTALGFYNMQQGDVPYFKSLADQFSMSDNFHQSVSGGTGANHIMFGHADAIWFTDSDANPAVPPEGAPVFYAPYHGGPNPDYGVVNQIENPNPAKGTNNWYTEDGYGGGGNGGFPPPFTTSPVYGGGSYSDCSDPSQPGVAPILDYLKAQHVDPRCETGYYYLLNNYNPGYFGNGKNAYIDQNPSNTPFTIPPSPARSLANILNEANVTWKYYGEHWNNYINDPYQLNYGTNGPNADEYCNICNPFQYDTYVMGNPDMVRAHIQDSQNLYWDIQHKDLPSVSIVKPSGYADGHPASSKLDIFEGFTQKIVQMIQNSSYWSDTAIFITFDEGGGYYDSGYVQPLDFFGDGTRIPLLVVSAYATPGHISHSYSDHVSIDKFIERNWKLPAITSRSRDNFPNPKTGSNPYVPTNGPALDDLFDLFTFPPSK
jgi:phospholipase C